MTSETPPLTLVPANNTSLGGDNRSSRMTGLLAAALLLVVTSLIFYPLARRPGGLLVGVQNDGHNDVTSQFATTRNIAAATLQRDGQWPWWNSNLLCGAPVLGNPQAALFYPPNWVFLLWRNPSSVGWMMVFHHWLAGCGAFWLCRKYGFAWIPSFVGAVCFLGAPYYIAHCGEGHFNQVCVVAWIPWSFLAFERFREDRRGGVLLVALTLALSLLCGHAQESYYTGIVLSAFVLIDGMALYRRGDRAAACRRFVRWVGVAISAVGLIAFELFPVAMYSRMSVRNAGMSSEMASAISLNLSHLWQIINPAVNGGTGDGPLYWETLCYFGLAPLLLACFGVISGWKTYPMRRFAGLWVLALAFALGSTLPVFPILHRVVPGLSLFRVPSRSLFFCAFTVSVLAAGGADAVWKAATSAARNSRRLMALCLTGALAFGLLGILSAMSLIAVSEDALWTVAFNNNAMRWGTLCFSLVIVAIVLARPQFRSVGTFGLLLLCVIECSTYSHAILQVKPNTIVTARHEVTNEFLENARNSRVLASQADWSDYSAVQFGVPKLQGYEPVPLQDYTAAFDALTPGRDPMRPLVGFNGIELKDYDKSVLDLLGVRYCLVNSRQSVDRQEWTLLRNDSAGPGKRHALALYENPKALPRAFVVGRVVNEPRSGQAAVEALRTLDVRSEILLARDVLPSGPRAEYQAAEIAEYCANRVAIDIEIDKPGYLFLSDVWYPGWSADVDGNRADVLRANLAFRAVALMPGRHRVTFNYQPRGLLIGGLISLLTVGLMLAGALSRERETSESDGATLVAD